MSSRNQKSIFTRKPDEKESVNFRLPAGTRDRITTVNARLRAADPQLNFDLAVVVETAVERGLMRAEQELAVMAAQRQQAASGGATTEDASKPDHKEGDGAADESGTDDQKASETGSGGERVEKMSPRRRERPTQR